MGGLGMLLAGDSMSMAMHSSPFDSVEAPAMDEGQEHTVGTGSSHDELDFEVGAPVSPKDKKKRRKKKRGKAVKGTDEANSGNREMHLRERLTFPSSCPMQIPSRKALEYEDADSVKSLGSETSSILSSSCPSRSALRGGQECLGLGPRPKLHVRWAQDVRDPPVSIVSHTVVQHRRPRSKRDQKQQSPKSGKAKAKARDAARLKQEKAKVSGTGERVPDYAAVLEADKSVSSVADRHKSEGSALEKRFQSVLRLSGNSLNQFASLEPMEMAMKHMLLGSKLMDKNDLLGAQAEYEAASRMFRMAKLNSETAPVHEESETGTKQATQGQALAWIAISTIQSARGETSRSQENRQLALKACDEAGLKFETGLEWLKALGTFPSQRRKKSKCSRAALSSSIYDTIRKDVLKV